jgi:hypothetical protein
MNADPTTPPAPQAPNGASILPGRPAPLRIICANQHFICGQLSRIFLRALSDSVVKIFPDFPCS